MRRILSSFLLAVLVGICSLVVYARIFGLPKGIIRYIQRGRSWLLAEVGSSLQVFADHWVVIALVAAIAVILALAWRKLRNPLSSKGSGGAMDPSSLRVTLCWVHQWLGRVLFVACLAWAINVLFIETTKASGWQLGNAAFAVMTFPRLVVTLVVGFMVQYLYAHLPNLFTPMNEDYFYEVPHVGWEENPIGRCVGLFYSDPKFDLGRRVHISEGANAWFLLHFYGFIWAFMSAIVAAIKLALMIGIVVLARHIHAPHFFSWTLDALDWTSAVAGTTLGLAGMLATFKKLYNDDPLKNRSGIMVVPPVHMGLIDTLKQPAYTLLTGIRIMKPVIDQLNKNKEESGHPNKLVGDGLRPDKSKKIDTEGALCSPFIPLNPVVFNFGTMKIELDTKKLKKSTPIAGKTGRSDAREAQGAEIFGFYDSTVQVKLINGPRNRVYAPTSLADLMGQLDQAMQEAVIAVVNNDFRPGYVPPDRRAEGMDIIGRTNEISDYLNWILRQTYDQRKRKADPRDETRQVELPPAGDDGVIRITPQNFGRYFQRNPASVRYNDGFEIILTVIGDITPPELIDRKRAERRAAELDREISEIQGQAEERRLEGVARGIQKLTDKDVSANIAAVTRALEGIFAGRNETARVVAERQYPAQPSRSSVAEGESSNDGEE